MKHGRLILGHKSGSITTHYSAAEYASWSMRWSLSLPTMPASRTPWRFWKEKRVDVSRRRLLIGTREKDQEVGFSGCSLLICKAMETGAAQNLRESHGTLRNKNKEVATV